MKYSQRIGKIENTYEGNTPEEVASLVNAIENENIKAPTVINNITINKKTLNS